jgi:hypothetical protein
MGPVPGSNDVAVLQLIQFDALVVSLTIAAQKVEPLNEALRRSWAFCEKRL